MSVPLAPRRLAERKYYFYAALSSLLPPQGLFLPLSLSLPLFRHPIRRSLHPSPHTTRPFHSRKPLRRYPLPRTGNHRLELRARCLEPREGSVGARRARGVQPPSQRAFVWPGFIKTNRFYSADAAR